MADFNKAFLFMANHEWDRIHNFTNDPADPGGATKYGVTQKELDSFISRNPSLGIPAKVQDLKEDHARVIYRLDYWKFEAIRDACLAAKLFDIGVNLGPGTAVEYLQQGLNVEGRRVEIDGKLGPHTLEAANAVAPEALISHLSAFQGAHYSAWCSKKPEREKFRKGLLRRAQDVPMI